MKLVNLIQEDFTNYKKPSLFLGFPKCSGKCNILNGKIVCQNEALRNAEKVEISANEIVELYTKNNITNDIKIDNLFKYNEWNEGIWQNGKRIKWIDNGDKSFGKEIE